MYFTRIKLDYTNPDTINDLTHLGAYHGWIEEAFPNEFFNHERKRHLWRLDQIGTNKYLLLLSEKEPDFTQLSRYGDATTLKSISYDNLLKRISSNQRYSFKLVANPSKRIAKTKRVEALKTPQLQAEWLLGKQYANGFKVIPELMQQPISEYKPLKRNHHKIYLLHTTFTGALVVTDPQKFKRALINGIGRQKAFGLGMLTIAPM